MTAELIDAAIAMIGELDRDFLRVALVPTEPGSRENMRRVATEHNPEWYRALCAEYSPVARGSRGGRRRLYSRKVDTIIRRPSVRRTLVAMSEGRFGGSVYFDRLLPYVQAEADRYAVMFAQYKEGKNDD